VVIFVHFHTASTITAMAHLAGQKIRHGHPGMAHNLPRMSLYAAMGLGGTAKYYSGESSGVGSTAGVATRRYFDEWV
jgi:hypothetical protein